ncbi:MAG: dTDP-4-dehydrorhamnose 3,5-epimerase [Terriglobales bacterium]|jgi:dTDP-4-dehydrorhamnose 3,5-epimerase
MKTMQTSLKDVLLFEPDVFRDERGFFFESYNSKTMEALGLSQEFVQDNRSFSVERVLRGLHYQIVQPQGKLVHVVVGEVLDVAVDLRRSSPTFGKWESFTISDANLRLLWIPPGFAHGFHVRSREAQFVYKTTAYYKPELERTIAWNDPTLHIDWQLHDQPIVSKKDQAGLSFRSAPVFEESQSARAGI